MMIAQRSRHGVAAFLLTLVLLIWAASQTYRQTSPAVGIDFYQFWAVGWTIHRHGPVDVYSDEARRRLGEDGLTQARGQPDLQRLKAAEYRRNFETTATPFLYSAFSPFVTRNYATDLRNFRLFSLCAFCASVGAISRMLGHPALVSLLSAALLTAGFEPLASELRVGNVASLQLAGLVIYAWLQLKLTAPKKFIISGVWFGLLIAFKPNLVLVLAAVLIQTLYHRQWRRFGLEAAGLVVGIAAAVLCSTQALGDPSAWSSWISALNRIPPSNISVAMGNMAPAALLGDHSGVLGLATSFVAFLVCMLIGLSSRRQDAAPASAPPLVTLARSTLEPLAVGCMALLLLPRLAWLHYAILAVPALLLVLPAEPLEARAFGWRSCLAGAAWLGIAINPYQTLGLDFSMRAFAILSVLASYALLCAAVGSARGSRFRRELD